MSNAATVMTAFLQTSEIASYFDSIKRQRVFVEQHKGPWPLLGVELLNNYSGQAAGNGNMQRVARYACVTASILRPGKHQDELAMELVEVIETAAKNFVYNVGGVAADVRCESWDTDTMEIGGDTPGVSRVWVAREIVILL